jgi:hypothetical protein
MTSTSAEDRDTRFRLLRLLLATDAHSNGSQIHHWPCFGVQDAKSSGLSICARNYTGISLYLAFLGG